MPGVAEIRALKGEGHPRRILNAVHFKRIKRSVPPFTHLYIVVPCQCARPSGFNRHPHNLF